MGKRKHGKPRRRKSGPITRKDPDAKRARREARPQDDGEGEDEDREDDGTEEDDADDDSESAADEKDDTPADQDEPETAAARADDSQEETAPAAAWAAPLVKLDEKWTWLEVRLLFVALLALTSVLCVWICLRGMKEPLEAQEAAGTMFRAIVGAAVLGGLTRFVTNKRVESETIRNVITAVAIVIGLATAKLWRGVGIDYFGGFYDWLQEGSTITLMGGLLGVSTRLTMTVALIGASLAASSGTHINVDIVLRLIPTRIRKSMHAVSAGAATLVCLLVAWGMFDFIAITEYDMQPEQRASEKLGRVVDEAGEQFFLLRKQMRLDLAALPRVITGKKWNASDRMNGAQWNEFLEKAGFVERYGEEKIAPVRAPESDLANPWNPFVVVPGREARGIFLSTMNLIFPFGFLMIGLRILLRALLVATGHRQLRLEGEAEVEAAAGAEPEHPIEVPEPPIEEPAKEEEA